MNLDQNYNPEATLSGFWAPGGFCCKTCSPKSHHSLKAINSGRGQKDWRAVLSSWILCRQQRWKFYVSFQRWTQFRLPIKKSSVVLQFLFKSWCSRKLRSGWEGNGQRVLLPPAGLPFGEEGRGLRDVEGSGECSLLGLFCTLETVSLMTSLPLLTQR